MKFLYARVSTEKQNAENQHEALLATVSIHDEYKLLVEIGSATSGTPPKLQECINNMRNGDTLVVVEPSRLGRKTSDLLSFIEDLKSRGVGLIILSLGSVDLHSAMGEAILTILTAISQMESKLMKERQARGIALARINNPEKYQGRARIDENKIKKGYEYIEKGLSVAEAAILAGISRATLYRYKKAYQENSK